MSDIETKYVISFGPIIWPLFLIAFTLKLLDYVDWSWFWVLAPLWVPFVALAFGIFVGSLIAAVVAGIKVLTGQKGKTE